MDETLDAPDDTPDDTLDELRDDDGVTGRVVLVLDRRTVERSFRDEDEFATLRPIADDELAV